MFIDLRRRFREEDGVALIVALMVAFVVLMLSTIVVAQSIHSLDSSGYDRERLLSVNAAEAGINHWYQYLQTTASTTSTVRITPKTSRRVRPPRRSMRARSSTRPTARPRWTARRSPRRTSRRSSADPVDR